MNKDKQVSNLFEQYVKDKTHAQKVLELSLILFEKINSILNIFDETDKNMLYCGALLHDIGYSFTNKTHNKSGRDFILQNNILKFTLNENIIIANIIRYHRGKLPKPTHNLFMNLDSETQKKTALLAGICRLADGLDANHLSSVKDIDFYYDNDRYYLKVFSDNVNIKKIITAKEKKDLLELYLNKKIKILI